MSECSCDYRYTCNSCQARIDAENSLDYANELRDWTAESLKVIAKALNITLPEEPKRRGSSYDY